MLRVELYPLLFIDGWKCKLIFKKSFWIRHLRLCSVYVGIYYLSIESSVSSHLEKKKSNRFVLEEILKQIESFPKTSHNFSLHHIPSRSILKVVLYWTDLYICYAAIYKGECLWNSINWLHMGLVWFSRISSTSQFFCPKKLPWCCCILLMARTVFIAINCGKCFQDMSFWLF